MKIARFFVDRPIFAGVLSIVIFVIGAISAFQLPISEYPEVVPPTVVVRAQYPGASPQVIAETVAAPLEQEINGVEDMLYMSSLSNADGSMALTRSEEHTSELQSRLHLVCRLLLEKKKKQKKNKKVEHNEEHHADTLQTYMS